MALACGINSVVFQRAAYFTGPPSHSAFCIFHSPPSVLGIASADSEATGFGRRPPGDGYPKINGPIISCGCPNPAFRSAFPAAPGPPSSVVRPLSSVVCGPWSVVRGLSSVVCRLWSVLRPPWPVKWLWPVESIRYSSGPPTSPGHPAPRGTQSFTRLSSTFCSVNFYFLILAYPRRCPTPPARVAP